MTPIDDAMSAEADAYFLNHPQGGKWRETAGAAARRGALEVAAADLAGYLAVAGIDLSIAGCREAVFEQALYLLNSSPAGARGEIAAETIDGVGSRSYRNVSGDDRPYSPRARMLLEPLLRPGRGRFGRG
jgi:hypothetical protein